MTSKRGTAATAANRNYRGSASANLAEPSSEAAARQRRPKRLPAHGQGSRQLMADPNAAPDAAPHAEPNAGENGQRPRTTGAPGPLAREARQRHGHRGRPSARHRVATWLAWWVLMMGFWVAVDDSVRFDELLVGAGAAALAALAAELVTHQAEVRLRLRPRWLLAALRLPWEIARDTGVVFGALARLLLRRERPGGEFAEIPVRYGDDTPLGQTRTTDRTKLALMLSAYGVLLRRRVHGGRPGAGGPAAVRHLSRQGVDR